MATAIIKSRVTNPADVRIEISIELGLPEWQQIAKLLKGVNYYSQLTEIRLAIEEKIKTAAENVDSKVLSLELP